MSIVNEQKGRRRKTGHPSLPRSLPHLVLSSEKKKDSTLVTDLPISRAKCSDTEEALPPSHPPSLFPYLVPSSEKKKDSTLVACSKC